MPFDSSRKFCRSCGQRKRLTWPKEDPRYCSMRCAAHGFNSYAAVGGDWEAAHCTNCGSTYDYHYHSDVSPCDHEVAEEEE